MCLNDEKRVNSTICRDQILTESLQEFWEESLENVEESIRSIHALLFSSWIRRHEIMSCIAKKTGESDAK